MRIISGKFRGLKLFEVQSYDTRSTTDRVKESMFNILGDNLHNSKVLDLFAGTGALGLEAISRGASHVCFVDNSKEAIQILQKNIDKVKLTSGVEIVHNDSLEVIKQIVKTKNVEYDYIFLDPPYQNLELYEKSLKEISKHKILSKNGIIIIECEKNQDINIGTEYYEIKTKKYGNTKLIFLERE